MKARETLPTIDEIKSFARSMRALEQAREILPNLQFMEDVEDLQAAKLAKMATELETAMKTVARFENIARDATESLYEVKQQLEAAESEIARLDIMAHEGAEALARERENSARIKRESDAIRGENQGLRVRLGYEKDLAKCTQQEARRLRTLIREFFAQDESFEVREALRKAVE